MSDRPARTVFLGSGEFAVPVLAALADHPSVDLRAVVTAPPRPVGRRQQLQPTPVGRWAAEQALTAVTPTRLRDAPGQAAVAAFTPELLVLADYGQLVGSALLQLPRHGALNLHPSLLPRHRGAAPIQAAIRAGDQRTGVTLMQMDAGLDSGPIVAQRSLELDGSETAPELEHRLALLAADLLRDSLGDWLAGRIRPRAQPEQGVTMTRPLRRVDGLLDPQHSAVELERQVRAYQPWPGTYVETPHGRLIVRRAAVLPAGPGRHEPGRLTASGEGGLAMASADGLLELVEVQPPGGRPMSGAELLRGRPSWLGERALGAAGAASGG